MNITLADILKFIGASGLIGTCFWLIIGGIRHRINEQNKDINNLIIFLDEVYGKAHEYWMNPPAADDHIKEVALARDLHYVAQEVSRINQQYKIYSKDKLIRLNQSLNEIVTLRMSSQRTVSQKITINIGRIVNHYQVYLKHGLVKKNGLLRRMALASSKPKAKD